MAANKRNDIHKPGAAQPAENNDFGAIRPGANSWLVLWSIGCSAARTVHRPTNCQGVGNAKNSSPFWHRDRSPETCT